MNRTIKNRELRKYLKRRRIATIISIILCIGVVAGLVVNGYAEEGDEALVEVPVVEAAPEPVVVPEPAPAPEPEPEPVIEQEAEPEPVVVPDAEPVIEQEADPEPVIEQEADPAPVDEPVAGSMTVESEITDDAAPAPDPEPAPEIKPEPEPQPEPQPNPEPKPEPVTPDPEKDADDDKQPAGEPDEDKDTGKPAEKPVDEPDVIAKPTDPEEDAKDGGGTSLDLPAPMDSENEAAPEVMAMSESFLVTYDSDGGTAVSSELVNSGEKAARPSDPSKEGYDFEGWYKEAACISAWDFDADTVTGNLTLYAGWDKAAVEEPEAEKETYSVTFYSEETAGAYVNLQDVEEGSKIDAPAAPERMNFEFTGWHEGSASGSVWNFAKDTVNEDLQLYAGWNIKKQETYTVTFDSMGGTSVASKTVKENSRILQPSDPVKYGYEFDGWYKDKVYRQAWNFDTDRVTADTTLYAKWADPHETYTVGFNGNGATEPASPEVMTVKTPAYTVSSLPTPPARPGNEFVNWNTAADGSGDVFTTETPVTESIVVYAQWNALTYNLSFDLNGGSGTPPATQQLHMGDPVAPVASPTRSGYNFTGWNTAANGSGETWDTSNHAMPANDVVLYAQWAAKPQPAPRPTSNGGGGSGGGGGSKSKPTATSSSALTPTVKSEEESGSTALSTTHPFRRNPPPFKPVTGAAASALATSTSAGSATPSTTSTITPSASTTPSGTPSASGAKTPIPTIAPSATAPQEGTVIPTAGISEANTEATPPSASVAKQSDDSEPSIAGPNDLVGFGGISGDGGGPAGGDGGSGAGGNTGGSGGSGSDGVIRFSAQQADEQNRAQTLDQMEKDGVPMLNIGGTLIPISGDGESAVWGLLNMVLALAGATLAIVVLLTTLVFPAKPKTSGAAYIQKIRRSNGIGLKIAAIAAGAAGVIYFLVTQNMADLMVLMDSYTFISAVIAAVAVAFSVMCLYINSINNKRRESAQKERARQMALAKHRA